MNQSVLRILFYYADYANVDAILTRISLILLQIFLTTDIMSDLACCQSIKVSSCDSGLPLYKSTQQDDDRLSVKTASDNTNVTTNSSGISPRPMI